MVDNEKILTHDKNSPCRACNHSVFCDHCLNSDILPHFEITQQGALKCPLLAYENIFNNYPNLWQTKQEPYEEKSKKAV